MNLELETPPDISAIVDLFRKYPNEIKAAVESLPHYKRFNDKQIEGFYAVGYQHYSRQAYEEAVQIFALIIIYRPFNVRYLNALAAAQQAAGLFGAAAFTYSILEILLPDDAAPAIEHKKCLRMVEINQVAEMQPS